MGLIRNLSLIFGAGAVGALANSIFIWAVGQAGITQMIGVAVAPSFTLPWIYQRLVWGGIWGGLFLIPLGIRSEIKKGLLLSLAPSGMTLFFFLPNAGKGMGGLELGLLTPLVVLVANAIWGIVTGLWVQAGGGVKE